MANSNNSLTNFTRKLAEPLLDAFDSQRVLSKNVNTQLLQGKFNPHSGANVDFKRPSDYVSVSTPDGNVTSETPSDIIQGRATGTVQNYITVFMDFDEADEALTAGNIDETIMPAAKRLVTDLELKMGAFMSTHTALLAGTLGTPASSWDDIAEAGAMMQASGVPMDAEWIYAVNSFTQRKLASDTRSLGAGGVMGKTISDAHRRAILTEDFAGMKVMTATTLPSYFTDSGADRVGTLAATPIATYLNAKDTMTQVLSLENFEANLVIKAGETIQVTGRNRLNLATRQPMVDDTGAQVLFTATVTAEVTLDGLGEGTITVTGPGIFETLGQYNTVDSALISGDVVTLLGAASKIIQPNMFWHKNAFSIGSVPLKKLFSTDTIATTEDGIQIRVSKGSDFLANRQQVRFDIRPAFGAMNEFFAGKGFGGV